MLIRAEESSRLAKVICTAAQPKADTRPRASRVGQGLGSEPLRLLPSLYLGMPALDSPPGQTKNRSIDWDRRMAKGRKTGGRKKGSLNKKTVAVKAIMAQALNSAVAAG